MSEGPLEKTGWAVAQFAFDHPWIAGVIAALVGVSFLASLVVSGIKFKYPVYNEMPPGVRFWLGFLMPLALNFWTLSKKVGIQQPPTPGGPD